MAESSKVELVFSSEDKELIKTLQKIDSGMDAIAKRMSQIERQAQPAGLATYFTKAAAGAGVLTAAVQVLRNEYDQLLRRQNAAKSAQMTVAESQLESFKGLGDNTVSKEKLVQRVEQISKTVPVQQQDLYQAIGGALGAKPAGVSDSDVIEAAAVAARQNPYNGQAISTNTLALMFGKSKLPKASFKDLAGWQQVLKRLSPTATEQAFAENIVPAVGESMAFGSSPRESGAFLAYLGSEMGDVEGRQTRTAALSIQKQLMEALPKTEGGLLGRLKALQQPENAKIRAKFLGPLASAKAGKSTAAFGIEGEAKAFVPILGLIEGKTIGDLERVLSQVPEVVGQGAAFEQSMQEIERQPIQATAKAQRTFASATQAKQLNDTLAARTAVAREGLREYRTASGVGWTQGLMESMAFESAMLTGQDPGEYASNVFDLAANKAANPAAYNVAGPGAMPSKVEATVDQRTVDELRNLAQAIRESIGRPVKVEGPMTFRPPASAAQSR